MKKYWMIALIIITGLGFAETSNEIITATSTDNVLTASVNNMVVVTQKLTPMDYKNPEYFHSKLSLDVNQNDDGLKGYQNFSFGHYYGSSSFKENSFLMRDANLSYDRTEKKKEFENIFLYTGRVIHMKSFQYDLYTANYEQMELVNIVNEVSDGYTQYSEGSDSFWSIYGRYGLSNEGPLSMDNGAEHIQVSELRVFYGAGRIYDATAMYKAKRMEEILLSAQYIQTPFTDNVLTELANILNLETDTKITNTDSFYAQIYKNVNTLVLDKITPKNIDGYTASKLIDVIKTEFLYRKYKHGQKLFIGIGRLGDYSKSRYENVEDNFSSLDTAQITFSIDNILGWSHLFHGEGSLVHNYYCLESKGDDNSLGYYQNTGASANIEYTYQASDRIDLLASLTVGTYSLPYKENIISSDYHGGSGMAGWYGVAAGIAFLPALLTNSDKSVGCRYYLEDSTNLNLLYSLNDYLFFNSWDNKIAPLHNSKYSLSFSKYF